MSGDQQEYGVQEMLQEAQEYHKNWKFEQSLELITEIIKDKDEQIQFQAKFLKSQILKSQRNYPQAIEYLQNCLADLPSLDIRESVIIKYEAILNSLLLCCQIEINEKDINECIHQCNILMRKHQFNGPLNYFRGYAYLRRAIKCQIERARKLYLNAARIYFEEANTNFKSDFEDFNDFFYLWGCIQFYSCDYEFALINFAFAEKLSAQNDDLCLKKAFSLQGVGENIQADVYFKRALKLYGQNKNTYRSFIRESDYVNATNIPMIFLDNQRYSDYEKWTNYMKECGMVRSGPDQKGTVFIPGIEETVIKNSFKDEQLFFKQIERMFQQADVNNDGYIQEKELEEFVVNILKEEREKYVKKKPQKSENQETELIRMQCPAIFQQFNVYGDGKIFLSEIYQFLFEYFNQSKAIHLMNLNLNIFKDLTGSEAIGQRGPGGKSGDQLSQKGFQDKVISVFSEDLQLPQPDGQTIDEVFSVLDRDVSGSISMFQFSFYISMFNELLKEMSTTSFPVLDEIFKIYDMAKEYFKQYDKSKNGQIDVDELILLMQDVSKEYNMVMPSKKLIQKIFKDIDTDNSGEIGIDEFISFYIKITTEMKKASSSKYYWKVYKLKEEFERIFDRRKKKQQERDSEDIKMLQSSSDGRMLKSTKSLRELGRLDELKYGDFKKIISKLTKDFGQKRPPEKVIKKVFEQLDQDNSQTLTPDEVIDNLQVLFEQNDEYYEKEVQDYYKNNMAIKRRVESLFKETDSDKSGRIELEEMNLLVKRLTKDLGLMLPPGTSIQNMFNEYDNDDSGGLSLEEFKSLFYTVLMVQSGAFGKLNENILEKQQKQEAIDIFQQVDTDGSGGLNKDQVFYALQQFFIKESNPQKLTRKYSDAMFNRYDQNQSNSISLKEFLLLTSELFSQTDENQRKIDEFFEQNQQLKTIVDDIFNKLQYEDNQYLNKQETMKGLIMIIKRLKYQYITVEILDQLLFDDGQLTYIEDFRFLVFYLQEGEEEAEGDVKVFYTENQNFRVYAERLFDSLNQIELKLFMDTFKSHGPEVQEKMRESFVTKAQIIHYGQPEIFQSIINDVNLKFGIQVPQKSIVEVSMKNYDFDHKGQLEKEPFILAYMGVYQKTFEYSQEMKTFFKNYSNIDLERLTLECFKMNDKNNNKQLEQRELRNALAMLLYKIKIPIPSDDSFLQIYHDFDVNGDGLFSYDEFTFLIRDTMQKQQKRKLQARKLFFDHNLDMIKNDNFQKFDSSGNRFIDMALIFKLLPEISVRIDKPMPPRKKIIDIFARYSKEFKGSRILYDKNFQHFVKEVFDEIVDLETEEAEEQNKAKQELVDAAQNAFILFESPKDSGEVQYESIDQIIIHAFTQLRQIKPTSVMLTTAKNDYLTIIGQKQAKITQSDFQIIFNDIVEIYTDEIGQFFQSLQDKYQYEYKIFLQVIDEVTIERTYRINNFTDIYRAYSQRNQHLPRLFNSEIQETFNKIDTQHTSTLELDECQFGFIELIKQVHNLQKDFNEFYMKLCPDLETYLNEVVLKKVNQANRGRVEFIQLVNDLNKFQGSKNSNFEFNYLIFRKCFDEFKVIGGPEDLDKGFIQSSIHMYHRKFEFCQNQLKAMKEYPKIEAVFKQFDISHKEDINELEFIPMIINIAFELSLPIPPEFLLQEEFIQFSINQKLPNMKLPVQLLPRKFIEMAVYKTLKHLKKHIASFQKYRTVEIELLDQLTKDFEKQQREKKDKKDQLEFSDATVFLTQFFQIRNSASTYMKEDLVKKCVEFNRLFLEKKPTISLDQLLMLILEMEYQIQMQIESYIQQKDEFHQNWKLEFESRTNLTRHQFYEFLDKIANEAHFTQQFHASMNIINAVFKNFLIAKADLSINDSLFLTVREIVSESIERQFETQKILEKYRLQQFVSTTLLQLSKCRVDEKNIDINQAIKLLGHIFHEAKLKQPSDSVVTMFFNSQDYTGFQYIEFENIKIMFYELLNYEQNCKEYIDYVVDQECQIDPVLSKEFANFLKPGGSVIYKEAIRLIRLFSQQDLKRYDNINIDFSQEKLTYLITQSDVNKDSKITVPEFQQIILSMLWD